MEKQKVTFTKRELRKLFRDIIYSSMRMSNLPYEDKTFYKKNDPRRHKTFIEDKALEYIMRIRTDWKFGKKPTDNRKYYTQIFGK